MADFDSLKREATKLERHLEEKVARYQQVQYNFYVLFTYAVETPDPPFLVSTLVFSHALGSAL
jgi:Golgi SNAP receptor complex protein 1